MKTNMKTMLPSLLELLKVIKRVEGKLDSLVGDRK